MKLSERDTLLEALLTLGEIGYFSLAMTDNPVYVSAIFDLLEILRLVHRISDGVVVDGEVARLFVRSMAAHLSDNVPMALDWHASLDQVAAAHGTQLLAQVEHLRRDRVEHPTPVREIVAVNAIIKGMHNGQDYFLMQYDERARQFQLIGGKRELEDIDAMQTALREIREELELPDLRAPRDLTLIPLGERYEEVTLSPTYGVVTSYHISFFHVLKMRFQPATNATTRWVNIEHMRRGMLPDGRKVSDLAVQSLGDYIDQLECSLKTPIQVDER